MSLEKKIWFITGISSGLGQALARAVMTTGDYVIGTFRAHEQVAAFNKANVGKASGIKMDITYPDDIEKAIDYVMHEHGKVDVLVNNAGIGFGGAIEETTMTEVRQLLEVNFFGTLAVTKAFLPMFRQARKGHIIQVSSHGGIKATAGFGIYNASKFALEGFSEALAAEIAPLGIKLTLVEPGPFRTQFAGKSFQYAINTISDYAATAGTFRTRIKEVNGQQEGDPDKAAQAIIDLVSSPDPPLRLPLGRIALNTISSKLESVRADMERSRQVSEKAVFG